MQCTTDVQYSTQCITVTINYSIILITLDCKWRITWPYLSSYKLCKLYSHSRILYMYTMWMAWHGIWLDQIRTGVWFHSSNGCWASWEHWWWTPYWKPSSESWVAHARTHRAERRVWPAPTHAHTYIHTSHRIASNRIALVHIQSFMYTVLPFAKYTTNSYSYCCECTCTVT